MMTSNHVGDFSSVVSEFPALIKKYRELYTHKKKDSNPTFFEVIGKENSETVMVNALAFFLDPENNHGFGDRVYQTFCDAIENSIIQENIESDEILILSSKEHTLSLARYIYEFSHLSLPHKRIHQSIDECNPEMLEHINQMGLTKNINETIDPRWENLKQLKTK